MPCPKVLRDDHAHPRPHQTEDHEQQTKHVVGQRKSTSRRVRHSRRQRRADHADHQSERQFNEQGQDQRCDVRLRLQISGFHG